MNSLGKVDYIINVEKIDYADFWTEVENNTVVVWAQIRISV